MRIHTLTLTLGAITLVASAWLSLTKPKIEVYQTYVIASSILLGSGVIASSKSGR